MATLPEGKQTGRNENSGWCKVEFNETSASRAFSRSLSLSFVLTHTRKITRTHIASCEEKERRWGEMERKSVEKLWGKKKEELFKFLFPCS